MPVSEVGDAVIGRGFALLHEPGTDESVDTAKHPYTLDNPAYGWFGLSSAVRVRVADGVRAVSVAEVVSPNEATSAPLARDLMVALVRAGVTATCSSADKPRYGDLTVDSNLPDARIALGGPDQNAFTAAVLAEADPVYTEELKRQLYASGAARVWVPAAAPLATTWLPGADLRHVRALPVLVIASADGLDDAVASVVEELADAEISVEQQAPSELEPFEQRTVAVLNRGVPGFAVDIGGTLHTSLMRSCTGWPSGVWIDPPPRRTAPDGSNFQLQHWTHTFRLRAGHRRRRLALGGRSHPQRGVLASPVGRHRKRQRRRRIAQLGLAVGNRTRGVRAARCAEGGGQPARRRQRPARRSAESVSLCGSSKHQAPPPMSRSARDCAGSSASARRPARAAPPAEAPGVRRAHAARLRDRHRAGPARTCRSCSTPTTRSWPQTPRPRNRCTRGTGCTTAGPHRSAGCPRSHICIHSAAVAEPNGRSAAAAYRGQRLHRLRAARHGAAGVPGGLDGRSRASCRSCCRSGEHLETDVVLTMPPAPRPGSYPVRAQLRRHRRRPSRCRRMAAGRRGRVRRIAVGTPTEGGELVYLVGEPVDVEVAAGEAARLTVTVGTAPGADLARRSAPDQPVGNLGVDGPAASGAELAARRHGGTQASTSPRRPGWNPASGGRWSGSGCAGRLRVHARGEGDGAMSHAACRGDRRRVPVSVDEVDAREAGCGRSGARRRRCRGQAPARADSCAAG